MRTLSVPLEALMLSPHRQPRYLVYMWDIVTSGAPTPASIIASTASASWSVDVTQYVHGGVTIEEAGDRRAAQVTFTLSDILGKFDPVSGQYAAYMQRNQVVHVKIGDATVSAGDYVGIFWGHVRGQTGFSVSRDSLQKETQISCYNRRATPPYLKRRFISPAFGIATDFGTIIDHVARTEMALTDAETRLPAVLGQVTQFTTNTIADLTPLEAIDKVLEAVGHVCDFDGDGRLRSYSRDIRRTPNRAYPDASLIVSYDHPSSDSDTYNSVKIIGLDKHITLLEQPEEALARATIPVGFWRPSHKVEVWWSNDHSLRARSTTLVVQTSANDSLMINIGSESYEELDEYHGRIEVTIGFFLISFAIGLAITLIIFAAIPDAVAAYLTVSVGRIIEAILLQLLLFCLAQQSSGVYEVWGIPLLPVYKEISATLTVDGTPLYLLNQKEIHNDWINSLEHLLEICTLELLIEVAQGSPRTLTMVDDYAIEVGDIIQVPIGSELVRLWVESLRRTVSRGETVPLLEVNGYLVPEGA